MPSRLSVAIRREKIHSTSTSTVLNTRSKNLKQATTWILTGWISRLTEKEILESY